MLIDVVRFLRVSRFSWHFCRLPWYITVNRYPERATSQPPVVERKTHKHKEREGNEVAVRKTEALRPPQVARAPITSPQTTKYTRYKRRLIGGRNAEAGRGGMARPAEWAIEEALESHTLIHVGSGE